MYSVLIIDDEPLARRELVKALESRSDISRIETAEDASRALDMLQASEFDVVFLDIQMPEMTGIELLEISQQRHIRLPAVVFVTAYSEYAVAAFEHHAVDYVLKPISAARIVKALDVAIRRSEAERISKLLDALPELQGLNSQKPKRIAIKVQGRIVFINPSEIMFVQAEGNYVLLQGPHGSHLLRESMNQVEQKLARFGFVRIHRSVIVNAQFVREFRPCYTGEYTLTLVNGKEFTVTRTYKKNLKQFATDVIGLDNSSSDADPVA